MILLLILLGVVFWGLGVIVGGKGMLNAGSAAVIAVLLFAFSFIILFTDAPGNLLNVEMMPQNGGFLMMFGFLGYICWCAACNLSGYAASKFIIR